MRTNKFSAFVLGVLAGAISTWFQPYNELDIFGVDYRIVMSVAALLFAFFFSYFSKTKTYTTGLYIGTGILSALLLRIIADIISDSIDHDLWPIEVAIFVLIAFPSAFIGAYLAELLRLMKKS